MAAHATGQRTQPECGGRRGGSDAGACGASAVRERRSCMKASVAEGGTKARPNVAPNSRQSSLAKKKPPVNACGTVAPPEVMTRKCSGVTGATANGGSDVDHPLASQETAARGALVWKCGI